MFCMLFAYLGCRAKQKATKWFALRRCVFGRSCGKIAQFLTIFFTKTHEFMKNRRKKRLQAPLLVLRRLFSATFYKISNMFPGWWVYDPIFDENAVNSSAYKEYLRTSAKTGGS